MGPERALRGTTKSMKMLVDAILKIALCFGDFILIVLSYSRRRKKASAGGDSGKQLTHGKHTPQSHNGPGKVIFSEDHSHEGHSMGFQERALTTGCVHNEPASTPAPFSSNFLF